jgi:hypothetical protein
MSLFFLDKKMVIMDERKVSDDLINMYNLKEFSDITFLCEKKEIFLNSLILSSAGYSFFI